MEKTLIDEPTGWEYELICDQYYPTGRVLRNGVLMPETVNNEPKNEPEEEMAIGIWGWRHLNYIRQHKKSLYLDLYMSGRLTAYLADVNAQAENLFSQTVNEMDAREGVTEKLKAEDQMRWVGMMNNIRNRAAEIVNRVLIFI